VYSLSQDWLDQQTAAIKYAIAHMDDKPTVSCPTGDYDTSINVDKAFVNKMADKFCTNDFDTKKEHSFTLANKDISSEAYKKYQFDFWYSPGSTQDDTCLTCSNAIKAMTGKCELQVLMIQQKSTHDNFE
jgi:hypothetical protein